MTVLEPTPERARLRAPFVRRLCFASATVALSAAFGVTLSGIASTRGSIDPHGQAAALAAAQQQRGTDAADGTRRHRCRRGADGRGRFGSGRV
jgi:hypothetical protein